MMIRRSRYRTSHIVVHGSCPEFFQTFEVKAVTRMQIVTMREV